MKSTVLFILVVSFLSFSCKEKRKTLFDLVPASKSGIGFENNLIESEQLNIIEYLYFYNGGGVAIGDINNDGLGDIYFSSNQGSSKLYLNKGNFQFEDITDKAGVVGKGNWKTGVTMADVNGDGLLDIYVCAVGKYKSFDGFNQSFINNGDLTFTERAKEYGLYFQGFSTQASFFDYDLDGDLDMYLLNHSVHSQRSVGRPANRTEVDSLSGDRLYRNELTETGKTFFVNVTKQAGILSSQLGYGLGLGISDVNRDGYPDIYVSNDFSENDYLYINQRNGLFALQSSECLPHSSRFSMGNDLADVNNDLWPDIFTSDMLANDESVIKTSASEDSYEVYKFKLDLGFGKQVSRNTLQMNRGNVNNGSIAFSDIAFAAGVAATDWSWSPLLADFDGDGWKDIFITNGIARRPNDLDYINFISNDSVQSALEKSTLPWIKKMPTGKVSNFIFRNSHDLTFADSTEAWGIKLPSLSNGSAYSDLDNDGDLDLVVNNIDTVAFIYRNNATNNSTNNFLSIQLKGDSTSGNRMAIGSKIMVFSNGIAQLQEFFPTRGWCSSSDNKLIFGLGKETHYDSTVVVWPNGKQQQVKRGSNKSLIISYAPVEPLFDYQKFNRVKTLFAQSTALPFVHKENDFNAFNNEGLIPHMLSTQGPRMALGDVNKDGLDDVFIGGAKGQSGSLFLQRNDGSYKKVAQSVFDIDSLAEDVDAALFDADGDRDLDLIVVGGGQEVFGKNPVLSPRLYFNDGKGNFSKSQNSLSNYFLNASCVKPMDYDKDGDIDLFIGSNVMPLLFGMSPVSYLFINNGKGDFTADLNWLGQSRFDNMTQVRPGMVNDATWVDVNKDALSDLILVGEWMPITILIQQPNHQFLNQTIQFGLNETSGWWNRIEANDFDKDGDIDFIIGNLGLNSRIKVSPKKPLTMYLGDFDSNGGSDHILVYYNGDKSYPFASRDQLIKQIPSLKKKFLHYYDYRNVILEDIITPQQKGNSAEMKVNLLSSIYLKNVNGKFEISPLPMEAQLFPIYAVKADDIDGDGHLDALLAGNLTATQPDLGPYDAGIGLVLLGDGKGNWKPQSSSASGFVVKGEARDIQLINGFGNEKKYLVSRNNNSVLEFKVKTKNEK
jgi:enediyne biosynthesis protein E4